MSKPPKQLDPEKIKHELDSVKYYAEMGVQHQVKMCNYIKKTQQNLVMLIEQLALHEQNSDLRSFLRRETVIPGAEIEEEEEEKESGNQSFENKVERKRRRGTNQSVSLRNSQRMEFNDAQEGDLSEDEESVQEIFNDALETIQTASIKFNQIMRDNT